MKEADHKADILVSFYSKHWEARPDSAELGQQVVLLATSIWDTPTMCSSSRKMFNLQKTTTWARVAAWTEWVDVSWRLCTPFGQCLADIQKSSTSSMSDDTIFPPPPPENSLRIATTLLSTTRKKISSADILWLHVQILLGAGQEDAALALVREEGVGGGGVARGWWRLKTVQEVLKRRRNRGDAVVGLVGEELDDFGKVMRVRPDMCVSFQLPNPVYR